MILNNGKHGQGTHSSHNTKMGADKSFTNGQLLSKAMSPISN